jgi:DNA polymerase-3 subunit delta
VLHYYYGGDDFGLREAYAALRADLDDGMLETNTTVLAPRGLTPGLLIQHASTMPFLASARLVVVEGLLATLGGGRNVVNEWQPFLDLLPQLPPSNHVLLLEPVTEDGERRGGGRSALATALRDIPDADVREFRPMNVRSLEPRAAARLVELVGADLWAIAAELEKLARYAGARPVSAEDVDLLTPEAREESIFEIVDAVVEGRAAAAMLMIRRNLDQGSDTPQRIQAMIARQLRGMVRAAELLEAGAPAADLAAATGLAAGGYPLRKLTDQARAAGRQVSEDALRAVEDSDHAFKTGRLTDQLSLELLVMRLAELMPRPAPARRAAEARGR